MAAGSHGLIHTAAYVERTNLEHSMPESCGASSR